MKVKLILVLCAAFLTVSGALAYEPLPQSSPGVQTTPPVAVPVQGVVGGIPVPGVQIPTQIGGAYSPTVAGTSDSIIVPANTAKYFVEIFNSSQTATVCLNVGSAATIIGTACPSGITLGPLGYWARSGTFVPPDAIHAIGSAASIPLYVGAK